MDKQDFLRVQQITEQMIQEQGPRNAMFAGVEDIFRQEWRDKPQHIEIKSMPSPAGHNVIRGMVNVLSGTDPTFDVPVREGSGQDEDSRTRVENGLRVIFRQADDLRGTPLGADMAFSGALFDMIALKFVLTSHHAKSLEVFADKGTNKKDKQRLAKQIEYYNNLAKEYPFIVDVLTPMTCFPNRGPDGIRCVVEARERTVYDLREEFGQTACMDYDLTERVKYFEYWDRYQYCKWAENEQEPYLHEEYNEPSFIPYVVHNVNGTELLGRTELFPTLYPMWKGDIWDAQNLALTMWRYILAATGNPTWIKTGASAHKAEIPKHLMGGSIDLESGDSITPLMNDMSLLTQFGHFYEMSKSLGEQSSVNPMVFGQAPDNVLAYSTVNLLVQGGRHGIVALQVAMSKTATDLARKMLRWIKESGEKIYVYGKDYDANITPDDVNGQTLSVVAQYKPDIPQDRIQLMNAAKMAVDSKLLSRSSARVLSGNNQPDEEEEQILREEIRAALVQSELAAFMQQLQPEQAPQTQDFIPPPMEETGIGGPQEPQIMATGAPSPEFQQAAAGQMTQVSRMPGQSE